MQVQMEQRVASLPSFTGADVEASHQQCSYKHGG
jgi:hypothetical protein